MLNPSILVVILSALILTHCRTSGGLQPGIDTGGASLKVYGKDAQTAHMTFDSEFTMVGPEGTDDQKKDAILTKAFAIIRHLNGSFKEHKGFNPNNRGSGLGNPSIEILSAESIAAGSEKILVKYRFTDRVVFPTEFLNTGALSGKRTLQFLLPNDDVEIYDKSCTDPHYSSRGDFWYFWNPYKSGCPQSIFNKVKTITAQLTLTPNTKATWPEYHRLGSSKNEIKIYALQGVDHGFESIDWGVRAFESMIANAGKDGFKAAGKNNQAQLKEQTFVKKIAGKNIKLIISLHAPSSASFVTYGKAAMEDADIFIYNGHSGLGGYLPPSRFTKNGQPLALPKDKYQIFFFNGCSTFSYYNDSYFDRKKDVADPKGTRNLDIITNGVEGYFNGNAALTQQLVRELSSGVKPSWQTIVDNMFAVTNNLSLPTALLMVNGDEDNPDKKP